MASLKNYDIVIKNGKIFKDNIFIKADIFIKNGKIKKVVYPKSVNYNSDKIIDASDCLISYGFFDPHVHFRCPGYEHKEDWVSGSRAAIKGGFTYIADMPNTKPPSSDFDSLVDKNNIAKQSKINFGLYIGLTDNNAGQVKNLCNKLKKSKINITGIKAFLGSSTGDLLITDYNSIKKALKTGILTLFHSEDEEKLKKYSNIKYNSVFDHNLKRPPTAAASSLLKIARACKSFKKKAKIYICHVSSELEIKLIKKLREKGYNIISEVTPHHIYFNLSNIKKSDIYKVNPPIRSKEDSTAVQKAFNNGFFDIIGTDHAPHLLKEKKSNNPPSGMPGLESCFYAFYKLYEENKISLNRVFKLLISGYGIFKVKKRGKIKKGYFADLTVIKNDDFTFSEKVMETKADFSPYNGLKCKVKIDAVILDGKVVLENGKLKI